MSAMPSWVAIGRECVCINADWNDDACLRLGIQPPSRVPMLNEVLRIVQVVDGAVTTGCLDTCYLAFEGIPPFLYAVNCFRPLVTLEDDITTYFAELLNAPVRITEEA